MTDTPIVVHATPTQPQLETALRMAVVALGSIAAALGYAGVSTRLNGLLIAVGPVAALVAFAWQQFATYRHATQAATMANALPDSLAKTK